jgi:hypothetical protein
MTLLGPLLHFRYRDLSIVVNVEPLSLKDFEAINKKGKK